MSRVAFDLARYMGTWYEIERADNSFQRACSYGTTTASYSLRRDGTTVDVFNRCTTRSGQTQSARGVAWSTGQAGRLRVSFVPLPVAILQWLPFLSAPYDVTYVSSTYDVAIVQSGSLYWILARTPTIASNRLKRLQDLRSGLSGESIRRATSRSSRRPERRASD